ncbi:cellulase family glycosylhydrolase [Actinophytocola sp.]|uniref:cellulase family glycosylhydrolase n=1 Tax=Actinophytocola sp. TaxID=1872138 RepID=UPI003D6A1C0E
MAVVTAVGLSGGAAPDLATAAPAEAPDTPWAVARHVWPTDDTATVAGDLDRIAALGARYVRTDFWWSSVEPRRDVFDAAALDYYRWYAEAARDRGLGVVVILSGAPGWARQLYDSGHRDAFTAAFGGYAERVAGAVGDLVDLYQVWNEPNHVNDWVDGAGDIALFRAGRAGLAGADQSARTIVNVLVDGHDAPTCPNWSCDLDYYLTNGAAAAIDVLAIDHYPDTWSAGDWGGNILDRLFAAGQRHGKAVAVMETGYSTAGCAPAWNGETGQRDWIRDQLPKLRAKLADPAVTRGVPFVLANWYELDDSDTGRDSCYADPIGTIEAHFGVVRTDRTAKPGYTELRAQIAEFRSGRAEPAAPLRVSGGHFVDSAGRVVLLRGVNVAGNAKVPPFVPITDPATLDPLPGWGINVIRLVVGWEAYEPEPGRYREDYLSAMVGIADAASRRGMYVIVDFHQDGFARNLAGGCGDGFPLWAMSASAVPDRPDNGPDCADWAVKMALDPDMHASFGDFYADADGVRTAYLNMVRRMADAFRTVPNVIGYDLLNEPWGREDSELAPLYRDAAEAIRSVHPSAIMFVEGHVTTNGGNQTGLPAPEFGNYAYAPHFYDGLALAANAWSGSTAATDRAFAAMTGKAAEWGVPLFVGEFGIGATATSGADYVDLQYRRLDEHLASGAQWNYTPGWTPAAKDGWNGEDLSIVDDAGRLRPTFHPRPYPSRIAGVPLALSVTADRVELAWRNVPGSGATELFLPATGWFAGRAVRVESSPSLRCAPAATVLRCTGAEPGPVRVRVAGVRP